MGQKIDLKQAKATKIVAKKNWPKLDKKWSKNDQKNGKNVLTWYGGLCCKFVDCSGTT